MIIDEQMWKQALAYEASNYLREKVLPRTLAGEAELFDRSEFDTNLLPLGYNSSRLPSKFIGYTYSITGTELMAYALVGLESETLYLMGLCEGRRLVWFKED